MPNLKGALSQSIGNIKNEATKAWSEVIGKTKSPVDGPSIQSENDFIQDTLKTLSAWNEQGTSLNSNESPTRPQVEKLETHRTILNNLSTLESVFVDSPSLANTNDKSWEVGNYNNEPKSFNLTTFKNHVQSFAMPQYFLVTIPFLYNKNLNHVVLTMLARQVIMPAITNDVTTVWHKGQELKISGKSTYGNLSMTFLCLDNDILRSELINWQGRAYNGYNATFGEFGDIDDDFGSAQYKHSIVVSRMSSSSIDVFPSIVSFEGAWPINIQGFNFDNAANGYLSYNVEFAVDYFFEGVG